MLTTDRKFAFLVHSRTRNDIYRKYKFLKFVPGGIVDLFTLYAPPIHVSTISGLKNKAGKDIEGYIIGIPMTARQMTENREMTLEKIKKAVRYAKKKGVGIIGFGALTASFSKGGLDLVDEIESIGITTGRAYTSKTVTAYAKEAIEKFNLPKEKLKVAIVGAGGSIGSSCAMLLAEYGVRDFLFVDLEKRVEKLKSQIQHITTHYHQDISITISHKINDVRGAHIIIAATNAPEVLIKNDDVTPGTVIINDAQPSDIAEELLHRDDVVVVEGGVIVTPGMDYHFNIGLASKEDTFCCLGEVLILAHNGHFEHFALGELDLSLIEKIEKMSSSLAITLSPWQNTLGYISMEKINKTKELLVQRL